MRTGHKLICNQKGTSLIEMMIAMLVLTVGLVGSVALMAVSINSNSRSKTDSTSAAAAEMVIGQISAVPLGGGTTSVTVTDCAGNASTVNTSGTTTGSGATLTTAGSVDYTQAYTAVTAGYKMKYTICSTSTGIQSVYDVRWNVTTLPSGKEEFVVVGAQFVGSNSSTSARLYAPPVNVRTVIGNSGT